MKKKYFLSFFVLLIISQITIAQSTNNFWNTISSSELTTDVWSRNEEPESGTYLKLNFERFKTALNNVVNRTDLNQSPDIIVSIPYFNGKLENFKIYEASVLHPTLQAKYEDIRSYIGYNIDRPYEIIRFSISYKGLNAIILNTNEGTQYIDCLARDKSQYIAYRGQDLPLDSLSFNCDTTNEISNNLDMDSVSRVNSNAGDGLLRTYRIAIACNEEYAAYHVGQAGLEMGTNQEKKAAVLAVMNDKLTRVNAVYENNLAINFEIIPNNENIIFLSSPFLDSDYGVLLGQSQTEITSIIGTDNFDIGHMFATGNGGVVSGRACNNANKARGITGTSTPIGSQFEGILMHEIGHQFSASHTWNGDANGCTVDQRQETSAYEPGSGTTIMAYPGLCGSQNVQNFRDIYFHQRSLEQMWNFISAQSPGCGTSVAISNKAPIADAGLDYTIPRRTPYKLTGTATDEDGVGSLTYYWEQYDLGPSGIPFENLVEGPLVRSFPPNSSNTRYIPRLVDYIDNFGASTEWEVMAAVDRAMNFKFTVKDNDPTGGQVDVDEMVVNVIRDAGPFRITSQNSNTLTYDGGTSQTVTWIVSGTNLAPINTSAVNILLSVDGGLTYDTILLANTANDGSEQVVMPNIDAANCRIMVEAVGNIFYNINQRDFALASTLSTDSLTLDGLSIYPNPNSGLFNVEFNPTSGEDIKVTVYDIRGRQVYNSVYESVSRFNERIAIPNVGTGLYLLKIKDGNLQATKKILIN